MRTSNLLALFHELIHVSLLSPLPPPGTMCGTDRTAGSFVQFLSLRLCPSAPDDRLARLISDWVQPQSPSFPTTAMLRDNPQLAHLFNIFNRPFALR